MLLLVLLGSCSAPPIDSVAFPDWGGAWPGVAPAPVGAITLTVTPLEPGLSSTLSATGLAAGDVVNFAASRGGPGAGPCPSRLHGDCLDVVAPLLKLGSAVADAAGVASVTFAVPAGLSPGDLLWFQAFWADQADAVLSDVVAGEVEGCPADYDPLTWDLAPTWERSGVADRIVTGAVGDCIADALLLPTDPADVWDDGVYTPPAWAADGLAHGRSWASWDQWGVDCHLFRMTIDVPSCPFSSIRLSSPWYAGIPANDNLYVYINNTAVWYGGTSYGVPRGGPLEVDTYLNPILDFPARFFEPGANELLIVAEEYAAWGGLGYVEPILVP